MPTFKRLVLSGGAAKGLAYIGVLKYIEEYPELFKNITEYTGCSIGAFACLLFILGYNHTTLENIFNNYNLELLKNFKVTNFLKDYGLDNGKKIRNFIKLFIKNKGIDENITFQDLYKLTNKKLITVVSNVNEKKTEYFSVYTVPNMPVYIAIQMSMAIPLIFQPIEYNGNLYVDGGLTCNFPVNYYIDININDHQDLADIIAFSFNEAKPKEIKVLDDYLYNIIKCSFSTIEKTTKEAALQKNCNIITIDVDIRSNITFELSLENKQKLYNCGYTSIQAFINKYTKDTKDTKDTQEIKEESE